jgi:DNA polymerase-3 subunit alpha
MLAVLKNEGDKDARTEYLIECKRLGLKVYLPDVNRSQLGFSMEPDGIRFGLSDIKYISDNIGEKIVNLRPFASYQDLLEKSGEKFSGVNSRAIAALNAVGAATFPDNPKTGKERDNFYEYLSIPSFGTAALDPRLKVYARTLDEYEDTGAFVVIGMVRKIVRKNGWARAEVVDETGSAGIFTDENTPMEAGNMYVMLVSNNRIARYTPIDDANEESTSTFIQFLYNQYTDAAEGTYRVVAFNSRTTKAGKKMADVVLADPLKNLIPVLVFPMAFAKAVSKMREGRLVMAELRETEDGTIFVHSV